MPALLPGQIRWAELDPTRGHEQAGRRPVLILTDAVSNARSNMAVILPVTGSRPGIGYPYALPIRSVAMPRRSWALPRQIRAVSDERIQGLIGRVSNDEMKAVVGALWRHILPPGSDIAVADYPGLAPAGPAAV